MTGDSFIRIESRTAGGETAVTEAEARSYEKNGHYYLLFETEGDRCRLKFNETGLEYRRSGELTYMLKFLPGEETGSSMATPYGVSELKCRTHLYEETVKEDEMLLKLRYNVAGEDCDMMITVRKRI